jgi:hypothetical protein
MRPSRAARASAGRIERVLPFTATIVLALGAGACEGSNDLVAPVTYEVSGTVRDAGGRPTGALVTAVKPGRELGRATSDPESGAYSMGGLPAGSISLTARVGGCSPVSKALTLPAEGPIDFRIEYCGWIDDPAESRATTRVGNEEVSNTRGEIVGSYFGEDEVFHGFRLERGDD